MEQIICFYNITLAWQMAFSQANQHSRGHLWPQNNFRVQGFLHLNVFSFMLQAISAMWPQPSF